MWRVSTAEKRLGSAITLYGTAALPFVIPSEADLSRRAVEGSAVLAFVEESQMGNLSNAS
jgi:hypothetical protein